jgi:hypothetical protein
MKRIMILILALTLGLLVTATSSKTAGCPNWSSKFDQITNEEVIEKLKTTDWDKLIADAGGPEAFIAQLKVLRKDAQERLENADRAAEATKPDSGPVKYDATWAECRKKEGGAHKAAKCEHLNMTEMILYIDGAIELAKCRQDQE